MLELSRLHEIFVTSSRSVTRTSELQSLLFSWYDYNETQKELSYLLKQERHQLRCLELSQDLVHFSQQQDIKDSTYDLKVSPSTLSGNFY